MRPDFGRIIRTQTITASGIPQAYTATEKSFAVYSFYGSNPEPGYAMINDVRIDSLYTSSSSISIEKSGYTALFPGDVITIAGNGWGGSVLTIYGAK